MANFGVGNSKMLFKNMQNIGLNLHRDKEIWGKNFNVDFTKRGWGHDKCTVRDGFPKFCKSGGSTLM